MIGHNVSFRARLHHTRRMGSKLSFFVFRQQALSLPGVLREQSEQVSVAMLHWAGRIPTESIVYISGVLQQPKVPVKSVSAKCRNPYHGVQSCCMEAEAR